MIYTNLLILILFVANLLLSFEAQAQNSQKAKKIADFWNETRIDRSLIESVVSDENCYLSEQKFAACMEVLQFSFDIATSLTKKQTGATYQDLKFETPSNNSCSITLCNDEDSTFKIKDLKKRRKHYLQYWNNGYVFEFSFENKLKQDLDTLKVANSHKFKKHIADMFNLYISIALEPHARIKPAHYNGEIFPATGGKAYYYAGVDFIKVADGLLITSVTEGSPAVSAGIMSGDIILVSSDVVSQALLRGEYGEEKVLRVLRNLVVHDLKIKFVNTLPGLFSKNVRSHIIKPAHFTGESSVGYIKLAAFREGDGCFQMALTLASFTEKKINKVILDLRNNGGGSIKEAVCIAGLFLGKNKIITKQLNLDNQLVKTRKSQTEKVYSDRLIVLINGSSASSSELLTSALMEHKRATVVGNLSYGKGTYQAVSDLDYELSIDEGENVFQRNIKKRMRQISERFKGSITKDIVFYRTGGLFLTPHGKSVQLHGIKPHLVLPELGYDGLVKSFKRQEGKHLYPLTPLEPICEIEERDCLEDQALACLEAKSSLVSKTIKYNSPASFLLDRQLAQTLFVFDCY